MKNYIYWTIGLAALLSSSCSTSLTYPPAQNILSQYQSEIENNPAFARDLDLNRLEENERQSFIYLQAKNFEKEGNKKAACDRYKYLAADKTFPNAQLSLIKSLKVCDYLTLKNVLIWNTSLKDVEPSFRKLFLENSIELADEKDQLEYLVNFSIEYTDYLDTKEQKEKHLIKLQKRVRNKKEFLALVNDKLFQIAPRLNPKPAKSEYYIVAKDYARVRNFKLARHYFKQFYDNNSNSLIDRVNSFYQLAFSYK